jgi:hypothetical protein
MTLRLVSSSPFARDLIRAALLLEVRDPKEIKGGFEASNEEVERALKRVLAILKEGRPDAKLPLTGNDNKQLTKVLSTCLGVQGREEKLSAVEFFEIALKNLDKVVKCEETLNVQLMKSEYYESTDVPFGLEDSENASSGDLLSFTVASAGYTVWNLGNIKVGGDYYSVLLLPIRVRKEVPPLKGGLRMPRTFTYEWAFQTWLALEVNVDALAKVVLATVGNKVYSKPTIVVDLEAEREALKRLFGDALDSVKPSLERLLYNVMSDEPDKEALRFVRLLFEVLHGSSDIDQLRLFGLRSYLTLVSQQSNDQAIQLYSAMKHVAMAAKVRVKTDS